LSFFSLALLLELIGVADCGDVDWRAGIRVFLNNIMLKIDHLNRRDFLRRGAAGLAVLGAAPLMLSAESGLAAEGWTSSGRKLNVACIGLGSQMNGLIQELVLLDQNIVALCDVDSARIEAAHKTHGAPLAPANAYKDYRELLKREKKVDAVVIATPDHWHAAVASRAIRCDKHVYCEKPLAHTVGEARYLRELARKSKVVTQTGNQGSASANFRRSMELVQAGMLGTVRDVYIWEPAHGWPNGVDRPAGADSVPEGLDWDFWLGPAPARPYKAAVYHPAQWRGWFDFGGGSISDFCCHNFSLPVRALELEYPNRIEVSGVALHKESFPKSCNVRFSFPARPGHAAVTIHFSSGGELPPEEATAGMPQTWGRVPDGGCLLVGDKGALSVGRWNNQCFLKLSDEPEFRSGLNHPVATRVAQTLPRAPHDRHMLEFIEACQGNGKTFSPFEVGGHVTEIGAAGLVALRLGRNIDWDGAGMKALGVPEANRLVRPQHRKGWGV